MTSRFEGTRLLLITIGVLLAITLSAGIASAQTPFVNPPNGTQFTLAGCRNTGQSPLFLNPSGPAPLVCDPAVYTTGNLSKGWNELDLVPFRLAVSPGASGTFDFYVGVDFSLVPDPTCLPGAPCGYDLVTPPLKSAWLTSDSSCVVEAVYPQQVLSGVTGGTNQTAVRRVTLTANKNVTCYLDWDSRLALGSHLFPGSSLQGYLFGNADLKTNKKTVPIPVKEILPQELSKTMTATQGQNVTWSVAKEATPASVNFGNTCDSATPKDKPVAVTVTVTKNPAVPAGPITVNTVITAKNPAARVIGVSVSDQIYDAGGNPVGDAHILTFNVPANSTGTQTITTEVPATTAGPLKDIATATYIDVLTGVAVPGNTTATATATVQYTGPTTNDTATIYDDESIAGPDYKYSVNSVTPAAGAFNFGTHTAPGALYAPLGTLTADAVTWNSGSQSAGGAYVFAKAVHVDGTGKTGGTLSDQAFLTTSGAVTSNSPIVNVTLQANPLVSIVVTKTIGGMPSGLADQTFTFHVKDSGNNEVATPTLTFSAGALSKSVTVSNLAPGSYTVTEDPLPGWTAAAASVPATADASTLAACSAPANFSNTYQGANLTLSKTATPAFRRTYHWSIAKSVVGPASVTAVPGAPVTFNYNVVAAETGFADDQFAVSGSITVNNPNSYPISGVNITDPGCTVTGGTGLTVPASGSVTATYSCSLASKTDGTNTATATWDSTAAFTPNGTASGSASYAFGAPASRRVCNETDTVCADGNVIHVTDAFNGGAPKALGTLTATDAQPYASGTFPDSVTVTAPSGGCVTYPNLAKITETGQTANATVEVCGFSGMLAPTETTCSAYVSGTNLQQSGINYSNDGTGKIAQNLNPGVFFYFSRVVPTGNGQQTITVTESNNGGTGNYNFAIQQAQLFNASCGTLSATVGGNGSSMVTLSRSLQQGATYIVAIKYSSKSIAGQAVPTYGCGANPGTDVCYSYTTLLGGTAVDHNISTFKLTQGPVTTF